MSIRIPKWNDDERRRYAEERLAEVREQHAAEVRERREGEAAEAARRTEEADRRLLDRIRAEPKLTYRPMRRRSVASERPFTLDELETAVRLSKLGASRTELGRFYALRE